MNKPNFETELYFTHSQCSSLTERTMRTVKRFTPLSQIRTGKYSKCQCNFLCWYNICIPEKNYSIKESKTSNKPWITKGFIKSSRIKNMPYKKLLSNGNEEMKAKYKYYRNRLNKLKIILKRNIMNDNLILLRAT